MNYLILSLLTLCIACLGFVYIKKKKKKRIQNSFNVKQPMLDKTNTIYKTIDGEVDFAYAVPAVKVHFSNNREVNITQWYTNKEKITVDFKEFSKEKILKTELEEILKLNGLNLHDLRTAVYNNKPVYVKDAEQAFICLFVTFGFYEQFWKVLDLDIQIAHLVLTIHRIKENNKKKSTFIKSE